MVRVWVGVALCIWARTSCAFSMHALPSMGRQISEREGWNGNHKTTSDPRCRSRTSATCLRMSKPPTLDPRRMSRTPATGLQMSKREGWVASDQTTIMGRSRTPATDAGVIAGEDDYTVKSLQHISTCSCTHTCVNVMYICISMYTPHLYTHLYT